MNAEAHRVEQPAAPGRLVEQRNVVAAGLQIEAEMNPGCAVVVVRIEHQILARTEQRVRWKDKLARTDRTVGDTHVEQIQGLAAVVVEFDQVGEAGPVRDRRDVFREHFVDPDMDISRAHRPGA